MSKFSIKLKTNDQNVKKTTLHFRFQSPFPICTICKGLWETAIARKKGFRIFQFTKFSWDWKNLRMIFFISMGLYSRKSLLIIFIIDFFILYLVLYIKASNKGRDLPFSGYSAWVKNVFFFINLWYISII